MPAICIDARHAKAALNMARNKTDANDAGGLAHLAEVGFYREVRVKSFDSMLTRTLVAARNQMLKMATQLSNQIRGRHCQVNFCRPRFARSGPFHAAAADAAFHSAMAAVRKVRRVLRETRWR